MKNSMIIRRLDALKSERSAVESLWEMIERFALPFRGEFYNTVTNENEVDWHRRDVYDSTVVFAVQSLAASLQGNLTSPSQKWFDLTFKNKELNNIKAAKEWLESTTKRIFDALQESNFNIEMSEAYIDLVGFGTSVLTEEVVDELDWKG
ncbi:MAG: hypothetical protein GY748_26105, partial [Planctomycetaceae bacterium]|nr:hypothetical protein [Planctomycetaceae bacterium]